MFLQAEYISTNREKAKKAKYGKNWCFGCDQAVVGQTGKCPVCGRRVNRKKIKSI